MSQTQLFFVTFFIKKKIMMLVHPTPLLSIYLSIQGGWEIKHIIFKISSFNKHNDDELQT